MKVTTVIKYIRVSPKKLKWLAHAVVGLRPSDALDRLTLATDKSALLLSKVIRSGLANAVNNAKLTAESLKITSIETNKGPFLKRWNPVSRGMAHAIKKRTSHIKIVIENIQSLKAIHIPEKSLSPIQAADVQKANEKIKDKKGQKK